MSEPGSDEKTAPGGGPEPGEFQLPLAEGDDPPRRLRRGLFGARRADLQAELDRRAAELAELRRDVTALWLAFGQHERTLQEVLVALERLAGVEIDPPGGREGQAPGASVNEQLTDLDQVLAAIQQATRSLERTYAGRVPDRGHPAAATADSEQGEEKDPEGGNGP